MSASCPCATCVSQKREKSMDDALERWLTHGDNDVSHPPQPAMLHHPPPPPQMPSNNHAPPPVWTGLTQPQFGPGIWPPPTAGPGWWPATGHLPPAPPAPPANTGHGHDKSERFKGTTEYVAWYPEDGTKPSDFQRPDGTWMRYENLMTDEEVGKRDNEWLRSHGIRPIHDGGGGSAPKHFKPHDPVLVVDQHGRRNYDFHQNIAKNHMPGEWKACVTGDYWQKH